MEFLGTEGWVCWMREGGGEAWEADEEKEAWEELP